MKSLYEQYSATHSSSHETFADLVFCDLIVLVLFVMTLAVEVSQRVRAELVEPDPVEVVEEPEIALLTNEEVAELSRKLQEQRTQLTELQERVRQRDIRLETQEKVIEDKVAALNGEQRFTGAREPAAINLAYDYSKDRFYFVPSRQVAHADRRQSGESLLAFSDRKKRELADIAIAARRQRGFTLEETQAVYAAFSTYMEVIPSANSYDVELSEVGTYYHLTLCGYIAGDLDLSEHRSTLVELKILQASVEGNKGDSMYPQCRVEVVDAANKEININGVIMDAKSMKEILLSFSGRGALLDLEGFEGKPPNWLTEEVLTPAGYIGKVPKVPR